MCSILYRSLLIAAIGLVLTLTSCNDNALVNTYHELPKTGWSYDEVLVDSFEVVNTDFYHQSYLNLRINGDYPYSNIIVKLTETDPNGKSTEEIVTVTLAEKSGKWLGSGLFNVITYQEPILGKRSFKSKGMYRIKLEQFMRKESLLHVSAAGVKVKQQEEIF